MADRGLFIRIAGGVDPNTIKSMRNFAASLSRVSGAARGLGKTTPGRGLESTVKYIKKLDRTTQQSITSIIGHVERYKRSAQELSKILRSNTTQFTGMAKEGHLWARVQGGISSEAIKADKALRRASLSAKKYTENLSRLSAGNVGYISSTGRFVAATDSVTESTKRANRQLGIFGSAFEHVNRRVKQFGAFVVAATVVHSFTNALAGGVRAMSQYDQGLKNIQAIVDITASQAEVLGDKIQDVSRKTKFSATEVAEGVQTLGQAGLTMQESMSAITGVARLATGTMSSFETVSDLVTTTLNAFKLEAIESSRVADVFANAINNSKLSVDKLGTAFNYVGAAGDQAGLTLNEVSGTLMTLADNGIRASTMGTGLRRMMLKMIDASSDLASDLDALGMNVDDINPKLAGWENALENLVPLLWDARRETVDMGKAAEYFGTRASQIAAVLIRNAADGSNTLSEAIGQTELFGSAAKMADTQIEGLSLSFKNLQDRIKLVAVALGEAGITSALKFIVDVSAVLVSGLEKLIKQFDGLGAAVASIGSLTAIGVGIQKILLPAIGSLIVKIGLFKTTASAAAVSMHTLQTATIPMTGAVKSLNMAATTFIGIANGIPGAMTSATASVAGLRAALSALLMSTTAWIAAISGGLYFVYEYANAHSEAAKEASKHARELSAVGNSVAEWGESLEDAFATDRWDDLVKRFKDVEVAGENLSKLVEEELDTSIESLVSEGSSGLERLKEAFKNVAVDKFNEEMNAVADQFDHVVKSAHRMQSLVGMEIPEELKKAGKEAGWFKKSLHAVAGSFHELNKVLGLSPIENFGAWVIGKFGPDKQEMMEQFKNGMYDAIQMMEDLASVQDWDFETAAKKTQEAVAELEREIEGNAQPIVNRFIDDMTAKWAPRATRNFDDLRRRVSNLGVDIKEGNVTLDRFKERMKELPIGDLVSDKDIDNIANLEEAFDLVSHVFVDLEGKSKELRDEIRLLMSGEKDLEEVLSYVRDEMGLSQEMYARVSNSLQNMTKSAQDAVQSYGIFLDKLKEISPAALEAFQGLNDVQKAEMMKSFDEIESAGDNLREMYEKALGAGLEEALKKDYFTDKQVEEAFSGFKNVSTIEQALDMIRQRQLEVLNDMIDDIKGKGDETEDYYDQMFQAISNSRESQLLEVEEGSQEALEIIRDHAEKELNVAKKRFEDDPTPEHYAKLLEKKKEYANSSEEVEKNITNTILEEAEKRIEARERETERLEAVLERQVAAGVIPEYEADVQTTEQRQKDAIAVVEEKRKALQKLIEEEADAKEINKARIELDEAVTAAYEAGTKAMEARKDRVEEIHDEELQKLRNRQREELESVREGSFEALNIREKYARIEMERLREIYDEDPTEENKKKKLEAEKNHNESIVKLNKKAHENQLEELETARREELLQVEDGSREALEIEKKYSNLRLQVALQRFRDDHTKENYIDLLDDLEDFSEKSKNLEKDITDTVIDEAEKRIEAREREFQRYEEALRGQVLSGEMTEGKADVQATKRQVEDVKELVKEKKNVLDKLDEENASQEEIEKATEEVEAAEIKLMKTRNDHHEALMSQKDEEKSKTAESFEDRKKMLENEMAAELLSVEEGSVEELRIRAKYAKELIELQKERLDTEKDNFFKNQKALIDAKQNYKQILLDIEKKFTDELIQEHEDRLQKEETILDREESLLERDVIEGETTEEQANLEIAKKKANFIKDQIKEKNRLITKLEDERNSEEKIKEIINEIKELEIELIDIQNEQLETRIEQVNSQFDKERELADYKRDAALSGIEEERSRTQLIKSNQEGVIAEIEKEQQLNYENARKKLQIEKQYKANVLQSYNDRLEKLRELGLQEHEDYKEVLREKEEFTRETNKKILELTEERARAQIRAEGSFFDRVKLGFQNAKDDVKGWGDFTVDTAETVFNDFGGGFSDAFVEFATGAKTAQESFQEFAHSFLKNIAQMIGQQLVLNALSSSFGGFNLGSTIAQSPTMGASISPQAMGGTMHEGGIVGKDGGKRLSEIFNNALRLHDGLRPDEFHAVLQKGEKVTSKNDVNEEKILLQEINRKLSNQQSGSNTQEKGMRIVNVLDPNLFDDWATSSSGEKVLKNFIKRNSSYINQVVK